MLQPAKRCNACLLDYEFIDAGDGPTVFVIMLLGFVVLGLALIVEFSFGPPWWMHMVIWIPVILVLGIAVTRAIKGVLIVLQYQHNAAEGRLVGQDEA
ncbi:MAG: DUF983 domain-containing protein [Pseudomonadota bacterium]